MTVCSPRGVCLDLARVLVVDDDPATRLTLQTVLEAGGYKVDSAATAAEAVAMLEDQEYALVLSDMQMESPEAGLKVLAHARMMDYRPATALITAYQNASHYSCEENVMIEPEDLPDFLGSVANLLARRVTRQIRRELRQSRN